MKVIRITKKKQGMLNFMPQVLDLMCKQLNMYIHVHLILFPDKCLDYSAKFIFIKVQNTAKTENSKTGNYVIICYHQSN